VPQKSFRKLKEFQSRIFFIRQSLASRREEKEEEAEKRMERHNGIWE
jgi:hypothetical protein